MRAVLLVQPGRKVEGREGGKREGGRGWEGWGMGGQVSPNFKGWSYTDMFWSISIVE